MPASHPIAELLLHHADAGAEQVEDYLGKMAAKDKTNAYSSKAGTKARPPREMWNSTRDMLAAFYLPYNRRLADKLGEPRFSWG